MGLSHAGISPGFRIVANDKDVTAIIAERFSSLVFTDEAGDDGDHLEITLTDHDHKNPIRKPPKGAELQLYLGYDGSSTRINLFICDEVEMQGWPQTMVIRARSAAYTQTPKGKTPLQTQKSRSWADGTKIGDLVAKIATEHGMKAAVSASLANIQLNHQEQASESDVNLLSRLGRNYDAVFKAAGGKLIFAKRGDAKTIGGAQIPPVVVNASFVSRWHVTESEREAPGTVVSFWHAVKQAKRHKVQVGSGEPVKHIRFWFQKQAEALAAANAEFERRKRAQVTLELTMEGHPDLMAEGPLTLQGFRVDVPKDWIIKRVEHRLNKSGGYTCDVSAEQPNSGEPAGID